MTVCIATDNGIVRLHKCKSFVLIYIDIKVRNVNSDPLVYGSTGKLFLGKIDLILTVRKICYVTAYLNSLGLYYPEGEILVFVNSLNCTYGGINLGNLLAGEESGIRICVRCYLHIISKGEISDRKIFLKVSTKRGIILCLGEYDRLVHGIIGSEDILEGIFTVTEPSGKTTYEKNNQKYRCNNCYNTSFAHLIKKSSLIINLFFGGPRLINKDS